MVLKIFTDGSSQNNPGPAGIGVVFLKNNRIFKKFYQYIGLKTNNQAEYSAVLFALCEAQKSDFLKVRLYLDSQLVVRQLTGQYKVKNSSLKKYYQQIEKERKNFQLLEFNYIPRRKNSLADSLAKKAIREKRK